MAAFLGSIVSAVTGVVQQAIAAPGAFAANIAKKRALIAIIWPALRTVGWIGENLEPRVLGLFPEVLRDPIRRFLAGTRLFGLPSPLVGSFRRGVAYVNAKDVAEGWLAFFPELLIEGTQANTLTAGLAAAIGAGDFVEALDILGDALTEAKLEDAVAVIRGIAQIGKDIEILAGGEGAFTILSAILADLLLDITEGDLVDIDDLIEELEEWGRRPPPPGEKPRPPPPSIPLPSTEEIARVRKELGEASAEVTLLKQLRREHFQRRHENVGDYEKRIAELLKDLFRGGRRFARGFGRVQELVQAIPKETVVAVDKLLNAVLRRAP